MDDEKEEKKEIEVVTGDGELTISPVYEHIEVEKPKPKEQREIIVPEVKNEKK
ncbi:MAG: hypothetical protein IJ777_02255 [Clostridia bacterium]|nr:hypothetical protein [Clostridia bacterium]